MSSNGFQDRPVVTTSVTLHMKFSLLFISQEAAGVKNDLHRLADGQSLLLGCGAFFMMLKYLIMLRPLNYHRTQFLCGGADDFGKVSLQFSGNLELPCASRLVHLT